MWAKYDLPAFAIAVISTLCFSCSHPDNGLVLVERGRPDCVIVTDLGDYSSAQEAAGSEDKVDWTDAADPRATVCTESYAAVELRDYLCRLAGLDRDDPSRLPIVDYRDSLPAAGCVVVVGQAARQGPYSDLLSGAPDSDGDSFEIRGGRVEGRRALAIAGQARSGTLYGVYHLLNLLGFRWYAPGPSGEIVPRRDRLVLDSLSLAEAPATLIRGFWVSNGKVEAGRMPWEGHLTDRGNPAFFTWMARNRLNFFWNQEKDWKLMKKLGLRLTSGEHTTYLKLLRPDKPYPYNHPRFQGDEALPPDPYPLSPEYAGDRNHDGRLSYSETHPEWYGMTPEGKRFFPTSPFGTNYCSSSPDGFAELMKNIVAYLRDGEGYNADIFSFWPLDGGEWCDCPLCKARGLNPTDRLLDLVYHIRKGLKKAWLDGELNRDIPVHSLIYIQTEAMPSRDLPADFDYRNIVLTYFPIDRCYAHAFDGPACTEVNAGYLKVLRSWRSPECKYKGSLYLGEYYNISGFRDLPLVFKTTMAHDIPIYLDSGITGFHYMHTSVSDLGVRRLINYQMAALIWNPRLDIRRLWAEYFQDLYGPEAVRMRRFYDLLEQTVSNVKAWRYCLRPRMNAFAEGRADSIFPIPGMPEHLHFETYHPATDDALDWREMMALLARCRSTLDSVSGEELPPEVKARVEEDECGFRYLEASLNLFDGLLSLMLPPGVSPEGQAEALQRARVSAEFLKKYRIRSPALGVADAFEATGLGPAYERFVTNSNSP